MDPMSGTCAFSVSYYAEINVSYKLILREYVANRSVEASYCSLACTSFFMLIII